MIKMLSGIALLFFVSACAMNWPWTPEPDEAVETNFTAALGETCGGMAGTPCDEGSFCKLATGACDNLDDAAGVCTEMKPICTREYRPVCGCDGKTYGNSCTAGASGVSIAVQGACKS